MVKVWTAVEGEARVLRRGDRRQSERARFCIADLEIILVSL